MWGTFTGLDKLMANRNKGSSIGFGADIINSLETSTSEMLKDVEPGDLVKYGLIPEFVGRLPVLTSLEDLDRSSSYNFNKTKMRQNSTETI